MEYGEYKELEEGQVAKAPIGNILENGIGDLDMVDILQRPSSHSKELCFLIFRFLDSSFPPWIWAEPVVQFWFIE